MGVNVCLDILPEGIDPKDWSCFYDQARRLLAEHRPRLASLRRQRIGDVTRLQSKAEGCQAPGRVV